ncbi:MAG: PhzF family phenazine biosynthesis protein [Deltaproteobacteria bacterium]|nr:PhzF family phenazine biosynthesis protein [Deltaproteobacteria bacterium]
MKIPVFQLDTFTSHAFKGNPAAVCILNRWPEDALLHNLAREINFSETAYLIKSGDYYELRWFSPKVEVDLCGHATLAAAAVIFDFFEKDRLSLQFKTKKGILTVQKKEDRLWMTFPKIPPTTSSISRELIDALGGVKPLEVLAARDYIAVYQDQKTIETLKLDFHKMENLDKMGVCVTAPGDKVDYVLRFFAPVAGIPEDPVTGSAHCNLVPYWANKLNKTSLISSQLSSRGGEILLEELDDSVMIGGKTRLFLQGVISLQS